MSLKVLGLSLTVESLTVGSLSLTVESLTVGSLSLTVGSFSLFYGGNRACRTVNQSHDQCKPMIKLVRK